jgi:hypothetical protein
VFSWGYFFRKECIHFLTSGNHQHSWRPTAKSALPGSCFIDKYFLIPFFSLLCFSALNLEPLCFTSLVMDFQLLAAMRVEGSSSSFYTLLISPTFHSCPASAVKELICCHPYHRLPLFPHLLAFYLSYSVLPLIYSPLFAFVPKFPLSFVHLCLSTFSFCEYLHPFSLYYHSNGISGRYRNKDLV